MSQTISPPAARPYGLAFSCRVLEIARSTVYAARARATAPPTPPRKRGPKTAWTDVELPRLIRAALAASPWLGEGYRKVWARLRRDGIRTSKARVLRLMREAGLLAPGPMGHAHGPAAHDGRITTDEPDVMWGTDLTGCLTGEGQASVIIAVDHCTQERVGIHVALPATRFEVLEPIRQGVREHFGGYDEGIAAGLALRHDHGSQFLSVYYQGELRFLGIESSPATCVSRRATACRSGSSARSRSSCSGWSASTRWPSSWPRCTPSRTATTASGWWRSTATAHRRRCGPHWAPRRRRDHLDVIAKVRWNCYHYRCSGVQGIGGGSPPASRMSLCGSALSRLCRRAL